MKQKRLICLLLSPLPFFVNFPSGERGKTDGKEKLVKKKKKKKGTQKESGQRYIHIKEGCLV
jgi:hypothetical protein